MKIFMPSFGMSMKEGTIERWLKLDGDAVVEGEAIVEITTEKLTNELEAPNNGILRIIAGEGETIECGEEIAKLE